MNEERRRKVKYSIIRYTKKGSFKFSGYGEIDKENLYTYNHVFEDCIRDCHKVLNSTNEFKGSYLEYVEDTFENDKHQMVTLEYPVNYYIWFRILS